MKEKTNYNLNKDDHKIVDLFAELGMPRNLAKTLIYIAKVDECRSDDIENGTNLRQPEVSIAVRELARRGWTDTREQKKKGKGRPIHLYRLSQDITDIIKSFEKQKLQEIQIIKDNLSALEETIQT
ncbi:MAG: ArsR family transcriptional regulator [Candidatus Thermoplasmatota archaeon]|nr:ArsR family transcriptional regulator [Candidatus Thermoplasmatota archaeon]MBU1941411.1 ArsR family transcriptional regulator [Candidatus Thermoplasmatota archaeon]